MKYISSPKNKKTGKPRIGANLSEWDKSFAWIPIETLILGKQKEYYEALSISGKSGTSTPFHRVHA